METSIPKSTSSVPQTSRDLAELTGFPNIDLSSVIRDKRNFTIELSQLIECNKLIVIGGFDAPRIEPNSDEKRRFINELVATIPDFKTLGITHLFITIPEQIDSAFIDPSHLPPAPAEMQDYICAVRSSIEIAHSLGLKVVLLSSHASQMNEFSPEIIGTESERLAGLICEQVGLDGRGIILSSNFNTVMSPLPLPADRSLATLGSALSNRLGGEVASILFLDQGAAGNILWQQAIDPDGSPLNIYTIQGSDALTAAFFHDPLSRSASRIAFLSNR